ncbi:Flagellar assembly factor FliW [Poriferisphaera corsica]|uniref:Flagellar assembly factor FliW n=2 Tax=Poriferisphaera corsica TaxID=2528020 RepID=A0A517YR60_9BACT|nr:Flagellar assembly factor FliW [Poriferisphaera corsica]
MMINTSRFGEMEVDDSRVISFEKGLLGFPKYRHYVLIEAGQDSYFWWLQSIELPELAFVVTDPSLFVPTYRVPLREEQMKDMGMDSVEDAQVFVIVNKRDNVLTGNLQGPLVINVGSRNGEQLVLSDRRFTTRVPLIEIGNNLQKAASA